MIRSIFKLWRKRKAISPIVSTIIIIAIIITAAIIVYFVIVPILDESGELIILNYKLEDTDATDLADQLTITVENNSTQNSIVSNVSVTRDGVQINWVLDSNEYIIAASGQLDIICKASSFADELSYGESAEFTINFDEKSFTLTLRISAKFSQYFFIYDEDFENFDSENWSLSMLYAHAPTGTQSIADWVINEDKGNHYWRCTSNNCQYVILDDPLYNFTNVNISCDLRTNDNDANGIIYRYDDSGSYPKFYIIWFTEDHPSPRNGPLPLEMAYFNWDTPTDQIQPYKVTVHYVEGDVNGFNWYKIAEADWTRKYNQWYTWRIIANESDVDFYIDNFNTPFISFTDSRIPHGYFGFVSFENEYSNYDNIYVWQHVV